MPDLHGIRNPDLYHGHGAKPPFFEGWYFKLVDAGETHCYAVIPGVFVGREPDSSHAFV
jgi:tocopherol cyclase